MKSSPAARSRSRQFLLQALYQAQLTQTPFADVVAPFVADHNMKRADIKYFREVLRGIDTEQEALRDRIESRGDRTFGELDPIEKSILYLGAYELCGRIDVPYRVVINEAIELARSFGATDSYKYINSVLDGIARDVRTAET